MGTDVRPSARLHAFVLSAFAGLASLLAGSTVFSQDERVPEKIRERVVFCVRQGVTQIGSVPPRIAPMVGVVVSPQTLSRFRTVLTEFRAWYSQVFRQPKRAQFGIQETGPFESQLTRSDLGAVANSRLVVSSETDYKVRTDFDPDGHDVAITLHENSHGVFYVHMEENAGYQNLTSEWKKTLAECEAQLKALDQEAIQIKEEREQRYTSIGDTRTQQMIALKAKYDEDWKASVAHWDGVRAEIRKKKAEIFADRTIDRDARNKLIKELDIELDAAMKSGTEERKRLRTEKEDADAQEKKTAAQSREDLQKESAKKLEDLEVRRQEIKKTRSGANKTIEIQAGLIYEASQELFADMLTAAKLNDPDAFKNIFSTFKVKPEIQGPIRPIIEKLWNQKVEDRALGIAKGDNWERWSTRPADVTGVRFEDLPPGTKITPELWNRPDAHGTLAPVAHWIWETYIIKQTDERSKLLALRKVADALTEAIIQAAQDEKLRNMTEGQLNYEIKRRVEEKFRN